MMNLSARNARTRRRRRGLTVRQTGFDRHGAAMRLTSSTFAYTSAATVTRMMGSSTRKHFQGQNAGMIQVEQFDAMLNHELEPW